jgi:hypothetical protein
MIVRYDIALGRINHHTRARTLSATIATPTFWNIKEASKKRICQQPIVFNHGCSGRYVYHRGIRPFQHICKAWQHDIRLPNGIWHREGQCRFGRAFADQ